MGGAVFPLCCLVWGQTMVEVMKASFKRPHGCTVTLSAPNPEVGHPWPTPPLETHGHLPASLGPSRVGSLLLSPGSWCTRFCLCPSRVCFPVLCKFWLLYGGVNGDLLQEGLCRTQVCCTQSPCPAAVPCWPTPSQETLKHSSGSVSVGCLGPGVHEVVWALQVSLAGMRFDSKSDFTPPTILLGLLLCPWMWVIFLVGSNVFLLMVVQLWVVILEFS